MQVPLKTTERSLGADNLLRTVQECVITKDGVKQCIDGELIWELADPTLVDIPANFLKDSKDLTGTLKLGAAVKTIGSFAFAYTKLTRLDLSQAASLETIGGYAFIATDTTATIETPFNVPAYNPLNSFPAGVSIVAMFPGLKECAVAPSGTEPCWELADPDMTDIPEGFLKSNTDLTGTLKLGAAVKTIGVNAFFETKLTGLDISDATSLVSIGVQAFYATYITGTLVIPPNVETIGQGAFYITKLTGLDLRNAASLVSIGNYAFQYTGITGTLVIPANVATIGHAAFKYTKLAGLDLSNAASLESIGYGAFYETDITGTIETPFTVPAYTTGGRDASFPPGVTIVKG